MGKERSFLEIQSLESVLEPSVATGEDNSREKNGVGYRRPGDDVSGRQRPGDAVTGDSTGACRDQANASI